MIFLHQGLTLVLRKPELGDVNVLAHWIDSTEFSTLVENIPEKSRVTGIERANSMLQSNADDRSNSKYLLAVDKLTSEPVGLAIICRIDWKNRHAQYSYIIGNPRFRGSLAAGDMNVTVYNYLFAEWNLHKVYGYVFDGNTISARLNLFGGSFDGKLRRHEPINGDYKDVQLFSILQHEFRDFVKANATGVLRKHVAKGLFRWLLPL
jgi:RimJ/RimL family protein N-acetyltransferase